VTIDAKILPWKQAVQKGVLLLQFKNLPKVNNRPTDENLPNLVTLVCQEGRLQRANKSRATRVTGLGEFAFVGRFFTLGCFF
jgi:hypothetical protein